jgi:hypothetical protein
MNKIAIIFLSLASVSCETTRQTIPAVSLGDAVIAAAKEARNAGATKLTYEASNVTTYGSEGSVVIPIGPVGPSFGLNRSHSTGSTVSIEVDVAGAASRQPTGRRYSVDRSTLRVRREQ